MVGGDLPKADAWTTALLTNPEVITVDQHSVSNHAVWCCGDERSRRAAQLLGRTRDHYPWQRQ